MYSANRTYREQTLPEIVQHHLCRVLGDTTSLPQHQQLRLGGAMRLSPTGPWRSFRAVETVDLIDIAFSSTARYRLAPLTWLQVVDECTNDGGSLKSRLWGRFPVHNANAVADGDNIAISQAMRYLAMLAWMPHAMLTNTRLRWREITENRVEVSARVCETRISARLAFDPSGDLITAHIADRPHLVNGRIFRTSWQGTFGNFQNISGLWMPTYSEAAWQFPDGPFIYWRGDITGVDLD